MKQKLILAGIILALAAVLAVSALAVPTLTMTADLDAEFSENTGIFSASILADSASHEITADVTILEDGEFFSGWEMEGTGTASQEERVMVHGGSGGYVTSGGALGGPAGESFTLSAIPWPQDNAPPTSNHFYPRGDLFYVLWYEELLWHGEDIQTLLDNFTLRP